METKTEIKKRKSESQNRKCKLSQVHLPEITSLFDAHRKKNRVNGGGLTYNNIDAVEPVAHMKHHENFKQRNEMLEKLKIMIDGRNQLLKTVNGINNRILAVKRRTDQQDVDTLLLLSEQLKLANQHFSKSSRAIEKHLKKTDHPMIKAALKIKGLGAMTIAYMMVYVDIEKADTVSKLWGYTGYYTSNFERYKTNEKGKLNPGNKNLRCALYNMSDSMIKTRSIYRDVYDAEKMLLGNSMLITKTRLPGGKIEEKAWKDVSAGHRHGAAMRKMIKHFLADWWFVHRTLSGLPTRELYVAEKLGHTNIVRAEERGWEF